MSKRSLLVIAFATTAVLALLCVVAIYSQAIFGRPPTDEEAIAALDALAERSADPKYPPISAVDAQLANRSSDGLVRIHQYTIDTRHSTWTYQDGPSMQHLGHFERLSDETYLAVLDGFRTYYFTPKPPKLNGQD